MKKYLSLFLAVCLVIPIFLFGCQKNTDKLPTDLNTYTISCYYDDTDKTLSAEQTVEYKNRTSTTLDCIMFNTYPNAFAENAKNSPVSPLSVAKAYPNGKSYGKIEFSSIKISGKTVNYSYEDSDKTLLKVELEKEFFPNESLLISFSYTCHLPNILHRYGYGNSTINFGNFYPIACVYEDGFVMQPYSYNGDPFYSDMANYVFDITLDKGFDIAHTGYEVLKTEHENYNVYKVKANAVRDFAFVLSKEFKIVTATYNDTEIKYYYTNDKNFNKSLQAAFDSLVTFEELFGKYPYKTLSVVEANFLHGGMEYPNLVYISTEVTNYTDYLNVIVHEIAHQWWYNMVGSNAYEYPWLDEGLTEYSTLLFYEKNPSYNQSRKTIITNATNNYVFFVDIYTEVLGTLDTSMNRNLREYKTEPEYVYMAYVKGLLLFENIRETVGDKKFFKALKQYFEKCKYKNNTPDNLVGVFEDVCGHRIEKVFNSWINGKVKILKAS